MPNKDHLRRIERLESQVASRDVVTLEGGSEAHLGRPVTQAALALLLQLMDHDVAESDLSHSSPEDLDDELLSVFAHASPCPELGTIYDLVRRMAREHLDPS
jgi:hypothetical protein